MLSFSNVESVEKLFYYENNKYITSIPPAAAGESTPST
jgi:hypothetical protein